MIIYGCTSVEPWQRGNLAKPQMAAEPFPIQKTSRDHVYDSRETSSGGITSKGGGCGCY